MGLSVFIREFDNGRIDVFIKTNMGTIIFKLLLNLTV